MNNNESSLENNNNDVEISLHDTKNTYDDCISIINDKKTLNHDDLSNKWEDFKNTFPQLYEMLTINDKIDLKMLKFLCDSAEKQNKLTSRQQRLENDFNVGDKLAKNFIYDKFPEPSEQQKEFIKNSLRNKIKNGEIFSAKSN